MKLNKTFKRELEVAFSTKSQPVWFRVLKYLVLAGIVLIFRRSILLAPILITLGILGIALHFWYRYKTNGWTKSYGKWKYDKEPPEITNN